MEIVPFRPELAPAFESLNRAWIERFFRIEQSDLEVLVDPEAAIVRPGGQVFFALDQGTPVGTAAAVRESAARFELAKMAVTPGCQGRGIGRLLATAVIDWSRAQGGEVVFLLSSSLLGPALRLYESLGFRHLPLPAETGYERADVYMELDLGRGPAGIDRREAGHHGP